MCQNINKKVRNNSGIKKYYSVMKIKGKKLRETLIPKYFTGK